jgi:hypothetical protein
VISPAPTQAQQCCYVITTVAADQSLPSSQCSAAAPLVAIFPPGLPPDKGTPAAEIGRVQAHDADEAIKIAIEQYEVAPAFRGRLMAYQVRR